MRILVTFFSMTGNTKKMAKQVYKSITFDKDLLEISKVENFNDYDLIFIGFPIMDFGMPKNIQEIITKKIKNKKLVLFISHAMPPQLPKLNELITESLNIIPNSSLVSYFNCQGEMSEKLAEMLSKHEDPKIREFGERRELSAGHPNTEDLKNLKEFTIKTLKEFI